MIIPPRENIEKIFRIYGNRCSFGDCFKKIIDSDNHINGNILFIDSNKKDSPRYNSNLTNDQITDISNLIMFCDIHALEVDHDKDQFTAPGLKAKLNKDLKYLADSNFEFSDEMYKEFLHHFIDYHDPNRFSHMRTHFLLWDKSGTDVGFDIITSDSSYIKPTRHFVGGKFEIIDTKRKIREFDKVVFYLKNSSYSNRIQADIEIKSPMRIEGIVPNIPKGEYFVSVRSSLDEKSKLDEDLSFTIL